MEAGRNNWWLLTGSTPEPLDAGPPVLGDRQGPSKVSFHPVLQTLIAAVGPNQHDGGEQDVKAGEQQHAARLVMDVGRMDLGLQQSALGID